MKRLRRAYRELIQPMLGIGMVEVRVPVLMGLKGGEKGVGTFEQD